MKKSIAIPIMTVLAVAAVALGVMFSLTKSDLSSTQANLTSTQAQLLLTQNQLSSTNAQVTSLQGQLFSANAQITSLQNQVSSIVSPPSQNYGPIVIDIGTGNGYQPISLSARQRVDFNFQVSGALVWYEVIDPSGNIIVNGAGGNKVQDGSGSFTASEAGGYDIKFTSSGILTPSVITVYYTVYG